MATLYSTQLLRTTATHSPSVARAVDAVWSHLTEAVTSLTWGPISRVARSNILHVLRQITQGELTVITPTQAFTFGSPSLDDPDLSAVLRVKSDAFWMRVALFTDLGLAEGYMYGDVDCDDVSTLVKILIANRQQLSSIDGLAASLFSRGRSLTSYKFMGNLVNSKANISSHYDLGNTLFKAFLSEDMNYSSAIFLDFNEDIRPGIEKRESLEAAQMRKMRNILKRANIQPGDRVLEIGTGWGSLSILAAKLVDCTIDTVTLSAQQAVMAQKRIEQAGLSDRVRVHYMDFRECRNKPEWEGYFDRFISVEMIEHVGRDFIEEYWSVADWALKPKAAIGVVQVISMPEARIPAYDQGAADFVQKWIFPGCYIPSLCFLIETMNAGSSGRLTVDSVQNIGPHYARTLREWKRRFLENWKGVISNALVREYSLGAEELEIFKRKWIYYFDYCEAGFATRTLGDHIITFTREGYADFGCDLEPCD